MGRRMGQPGLWKGLLVLTCIALLPAAWLALQAPRNFDPKAFRRAPTTDGTAMARDFVARCSWRGATRSELVAWLGEPDIDATIDSWPLPSACAELVRDACPPPGPGRGPGLATDRPRLLFDKSEWGFRVMADSGFRDAPRVLVAEHYDPDGFTWSDVPASVPGTLSGTLMVAAMRGASEELTRLEWCVKRGGASRSAAWLHVRLVDDRAVDAWMSPDW